MKIKKTPNEYSTFDIEIFDDELVLTFSQTGEDYEMSLRKIDYTQIEELEFLIPTASSKLYESFLKMYESIITGNILETGKYNTLEVSTSLYKWIVDDDIITIISDNTPLNCPNILRISSTENGILLHFIKKDGKDFYVPKLPFVIPIGIRQSGSRLYEFSIPFKTLFRNLGRIEEPTNETENKTRKFVNRPHKDKEDKPL